MTDLQNNYPSPQIFVIDPTKDLAKSLEDELANQKPVPQPAEVTIINQTQDSIKIEQIRELTQQLSYAKFGANPRYVAILAAEQLTIPAQNAFLKLLEEPPANTHIWLFTSYPEAFLPTIHSRCNQQLRLSKSADQKSTESSELIDLDVLAKASHRELIDLAENHKDRSDAKEYVTDLLYETHQQLEKEPADTKYSQVLSLILTAQQQLAANANARLTLEHLLFACKQALLQSKK